MTQLNPGREETITRCHLARRVGAGATRCPFGASLAVEALLTERSGCERAITRRRDGRGVWSNLAHHVRARREGLGVVERLDLDAAVAGEPELRALAARVRQLPDADARALEQRALRHRRAPLELGRERLGRRAHEQKPELEQWHARRHEQSAWRVACSSLVVLVLRRVAVCARAVPRGALAPRRPRGERSGAGARRRGETSFLEGAGIGRVVRHDAGVVEMLPPAFPELLCTVEHAALPLSPRLPRGGARPHCCGDRLPPTRAPFCTRWKTFCPREDGRRPSMACSLSLSPLALSLT